MKGYTHVYTGDGKGKTTAAFGLALRAVGAGKKVYIAQFVKGREYSEIKAAEMFLPLVTVKQYGLSCFIRNAPTENDVKAALNGLDEVNSVIQNGEHDLVIMDEVNIAFYYNLFETHELIDIIKNKRAETEIILTGRYAPPEIIEIADLVTEMRETKHYYNQGVEAREGIEY